MIFCKVFVFLCVACVVFAIDDSAETSTQSAEVTTIPPGSSESTEEDVVTVSVTEATTTTENPVEVEPKIQAGQIHPSSAQLQVNETEPVHLIGVTLCDKDTSCADLQNAYCREGICHCQQSFIPHPNNGTLCIQEFEKVGDKCEITRQCESVGAICRNGVCALENIVSAKIPMSVGLNTASSVLSGSFFILSATSLFLVC